MRNALRGALLLGSVLFAAGATQAGTLTTLYSFNGNTGSTDGYGPQSGLIYASSQFYGTTQYGGANGTGTVYSIATIGSPYTIQHSFAAQDGAPYFGNADGMGSVSPLVQVGSELYGTAIYGGTYNNGTIFKIAPVGGAFTVLYTFSLSGITDGSRPFAGLTYGSDGYLYGVTEQGGANNTGTIFKISPTTGAFSVVMSFAALDSSHDNATGATPQGALIQGSDGYFYGTASGGGTHGWGTVFKFLPSPLTFVTLHNFNITDGEQPASGLIKSNTTGTFYGVAGGGTALGVVYKITSTGTYTKLCNLNESPFSSPVLAIDGNIYGSALSGGANGAGAIYKVTTGGTQTNLYSFPGAGGMPAGALIQGPSGAFYGTTLSDGVYGYGSVFEYTP